MSWSQLARSQAGAISRGQLQELGVSHGQIDTLLLTGAIETQVRGVFVARGAPVSYLTRAWIAVLATDGTVGFRTAAHFWQTLDEEPTSVDVIVGHERRVSIPFGVRVHRVFVPLSACTQMHGLPLTTRAWTMLDVVGRSRGSEAFRLADRALQCGWFSAGDIGARLRDYPGRTGNTMLRRVAAQCSDGAAAKSERVLLKLLRRARITGWVPNYRLAVGSSVAYLDVAFPDIGLAIEIDGWAYHSDVDRFQRDRHRQNALHLAGWTVLRFTWSDLVNRPDYVITTIRARVAMAG